MASSIADPSPSVTELIANRSNDFIRPSASLRNPVRNTCRSRPRSLICRSSGSRSSPSPTMRNARVGHLAHDARRGGDQMPLALVRRRAPRRCRRRGAPCGSQNVACASTTGCLSIDPRLTPSCTIVDAVGRHAVGLEHAGDHARRGDEHVDLPVLPARERVTLEMKVHAPRGDDERRGVGRDGICSAIAASATPIGSCAWTTSGLTSRDDLAELPAGVDVELAPRREADEPQALARAPPQLAAFVRDEHAPAGRAPRAR